MTWPRCLAKWGREPGRSASEVVRRKGQHLRAEGRSFHHTSCVSFRRVIDHAWRGRCELTDPPDAPSPASLFLYHSTPLRSSTPHCS